MKKHILGAAIAAVTLLFTSCSEIMGYSTLLWNLPEQNLCDGELVPVYIKSNISHVYVAGFNDDEKFEVPLWKMTEPVKLKQAQKENEKYKAYARQYASAKIDGLPIRAQTVNTAKQVYRLRKGETVKILYKGTGQPVMAGQNALEGDWLRVLTKDGTQGWCFSYNLSQFEADAAGNPIGGVSVVVEEEKDELFESIMSRIWYPDTFKNLIAAGNIDLNQLNASYNLSFDLENKKVHLNMQKIHESWDFEGYSKLDDYEYELTNIPIKIYYRRQGFIVARYTDDSGKPQDIDLVTLDVNINELIATEKDRRQEAFEKITQNGTSYMSSNYGALTINEDGTFRWTNFKLLVPSIIDAGSKNGGTVNVKYSISKKLKENYDGVLTFKFDGMTNEVNFLYKLESGDIRLEDATSATLDGNMFSARSTSPTVIYFKGN